MKTLNNRMHLYCPVCNESTRISNGWSAMRELWWGGVITDDGDPRQRLDHFMRLHTDCSARAGREPGTHFEIRYDFADDEERVLPSDCKSGVDRRTDGDPA